MSDVFDDIIESLREENSSLKASLLTERRRLNKYKKEAELFREIKKKYPDIASEFESND